MNVLVEEKKQRVIALGKLGWSLRRIQRETQIRRETTAAYLKAAGVAVRPPGGWGHRPAVKPAIDVTTDFGAGSAREEVVPAEPQPGRSHSASACEPFREVIELGVSRGPHSRRRSPETSRGMSAAISNLAPLAADNGAQLLVFPELS